MTIFGTSEIAIVNAANLAWTELSFYQLPRLPLPDLPIKPVKLLPLRTKKPIPLPMPDAILGGEDGEDGEDVMARVVRCVTSEGEENHSRFDTTHQFDLSLSYP